MAGKVPQTPKPGGYWSARCRRALMITRDMRELISHRRVRVDAPGERV
jgi:hypothetical protein